MAVLTSGTPLATLALPVVPPFVCGQIHFKGKLRVSKYPSGSYTQYFGERYDETMSLWKKETSNVNTEAEAISRMINWVKTFTWDSLATKIKTPMDV